MTLFQGRRWDAPMSDDAVRADLSGRDCAMCQEPITADDDAVALGSIFHTECLLRSSLGDVPHLEGRCLCAGGTEHDDEGSYRDGARRTVAWLVEHGRGRWASVETT